MPQDLPGFYYDEQKNRYFPIKSPIPGSSRNIPSSSASAQTPLPKPTQITSLCERTRLRTSKLLQIRELYGNIVTLDKRKRNFKEEFHKIQASRPVVWTYPETDRTCDGALEHIHINVETPEGQTETDVLLAGGMNGLLSFLGVGKGGECFNHREKFVPDCVWPPSKENQEHCVKVPEDIWSLARMSLTSKISCIKFAGKHRTVDGSNIQHLLTTTMGSESSRGSVSILKLAEPFNFNPYVPMRRRLHEVSCFNCTIWTADCESSGSRAVIGTNRGAASVDLETGRPSWVLRSRSDVLALQFVHSGNVVLCGLRNGAIVTVDVRQKTQSQETLSARWVKVPFSNFGRNDQSSRKKRFELEGYIDRSHTLCMPSSISCLVSLQSYDQYFLASSMDGSVKLYDHRRLQKEAVQCYEGHVNSHTSIQLGVDPSERFVISGGEDCNLRLWSIKSGELLFENKFSNSVPSTVCWPRDESKLFTQSYREYLYAQNRCSDVWLGSWEGLFRITLT